jgi:hypothetical protein
MQSENFDDKLKQAAEQHHPNYDEKAWAKMEKLLDRELPQKEDRRRRFIFLLFLLLIGGGLWLLIDKPWQQGGSAKASGENPMSLEQGKSTNTSLPSSSNADKKEQPPAKPVSSNNRNEEVQNKAGSAAGIVMQEGPVHMDQKSKTVIAGRQNSDQGKFPVKSKKSVLVNENGLQVDVSSGAVDRKNKPANDKTIPEVKQQNDNTGDISNVIQGKQKVNDAPKAVAADIAGNPVQAVTDKPVQTPATGSKKDSIGASALSGQAAEKTAKTKGQNKKKNVLFFAFSAGPDISAVGFDKPGKVKLLTGAGVGYTIKGRWTIRTGFYSASKVYDAAPGDYKPSVSVLYPNYLEKISADCKVYEIPLTVGYNFGRSAKSIPFVSAGLSSFVMKKEKYDYYYLYPGNPQPTNSYTHIENNKYKHYFSVLSLSAGYQRRINSTFSLSAEPYLKLPLAGVGYGKVKLNSAGILFSLNISPTGAGAGK